VKRAAIIALGVVATWMGVLLVLDVVFGARQNRSVIDHMTESLGGTTNVGDTDLALVRGRLRIEQLAVRRDDVIGHLALDVEDLRCELGPLGWALVDRDCRELAIRGIHLELSSAALFKLPHPARRPIHAHHVMIDDARLEAAPSAFVPSLGRIAIDIEHAEAGDTVFVTPLSWIFSLTELRAKIDLPAGVSLTLAYRDGKLGAASSLFGSTPVELPLQLPILAVERTAHDEIVALVGLFTGLAEQLVAKRAEDWLRSKLP
jgi:hypothetical protein